MNQRKLLLSLTTAMFIIGIVVVIIMLTSSLKPNTSKLDDRQTSIKLSAIETGTVTPINITLGPMVVFIPNKEQIDDLVSINSLVVGPEYNLSNVPKIFIYRPLGSMGCRLSMYDKGSKDMSAFKIEWPGGWIDPCRPGAWDFAGRVIKNINTPPEYADKLRNLDSPKYEIEQGIIRFYPLVIQ